MISHYFVVSVDSPGLFSVLPNIATNGTLTYAPAIDRVGTTTVSVQVRDSGGRANGGNDLSEVKTFTITVNPVPDTNPPLPKLTSNATAITNQLSFKLQVDFGEPVLGFDLKDVTVSAGSLSELVDLTDGKFEITYIGNAGTVQFVVPDNVVTDLAGNSNTNSELLEIAIDPDAFVPEIHTDTLSVINDETFEVSIEFGREVSRFTLNQIAIINGTASNLVLVNPKTGSYKASVIAMQDGPISVFIPAGSVSELAGNPNSVSNIITRTVDRVPPAPLIDTIVPSLTVPTNFSAFFDFGESVSGFEQSDLVVSGASLSSFRLVRPGLYAAIVAPNDTAVIIDLPAGSATDLAGNPNSAAETFSVSFGPPPTAPEAIADFAMAVGGREAIINILQNDFPGSRPLAPDSVEVLAGPTDGSWNVDSQGFLRYTPITGWDGTAAFQYRVADDQGRWSNSAEVSVRVRRSPLQNPELATDVNADGRTDPFDALMIINLLNRVGQNSLAVDIQQDGPPFYDVSGDSQINPTDALIIINFLNRQSSGGFGSGEFSGESEDWDRSARTAPTTTTEIFPIVSKMKDDESFKYREPSKKSCRANHPAIDAVFGQWDNDEEESIGDELLPAIKHELYDRQI